MNSFIWKDNCTIIQPSRGSLSPQAAFNYQEGTNASVKGSEGREEDQELEIQEDDVSTTSRVFEPKALTRKLSLNEPSISVESTSLNKLMSNPAPLADLAKHGSQESHFDSEEGRSTCAEEPEELAEGSSSCKEFYNKNGIKVVGQTEQLLEDMGRRTDSYYRARYLKSLHHELNRGLEKPRVNLLSKLNQTNCRH